MNRSVTLHCVSYGGATAAPFAAVLAGRKHGCKRRSRGTTRLTHYVTFAIVLAAAFAAGCAGQAISDKDQVRILTETNRDLQSRLVASEQRVAELMAAGARPVAIQSQPADPFRPVALRFSKYTGVLEDTPGGRLKVILEPLDAEGDLVKRAGGLVLEALVPGEPDKPPDPFHTWTFPVDELRETWISTLGVRGYVLKLPWPEGRRPPGKTLILRAAFTPLGAEALRAETQVPLMPNSPAKASG